MYLDWSDFLKWIKFSLKTTTQAVDLISSGLEELGIEGIEIEDKIPISEEDKKKMFIDILPELDEDDGTAIVSFYVDIDRNLDELQIQINQMLSEISNFVDIGERILKISETEDKDWINNWKQFFKPFRISDNIIIKPTWEDLTNKQDNDIIVEMDPGTAFGVGSHETTKLCILSLKKYVNSNFNILDVGCGSGILSIIALKLGAVSVMATDIDENAVNTAYENIKVNNIDKGKFTAITGNIIEDKNIKDIVGYKKYDIVVANILADVIIMLSNNIDEHIKDDGIFISSGIINIKKDEVKKEFLKNNFEIIEINEMGDWVSFVTKKRK